MDVRTELSQWPLAGRDRELEAFELAWADRRCRGQVIFGAAGVGKSRLAEECLARAVRAGFRGGRAKASTAAAAVPLGAIAHLIPAGVDLSDPVKGFTEVANALAGPQRHRYALLIDDLHLLDATSAMLLRQLLDAGVVRLIATVRSGEPVGKAVDTLAGGDGMHRIDLAKLDHEQTGAVLEAALGGPIGRHTLHELYAASDGNVLYLRELVTGALQTGALASDGEIWELTEDRLAGTPKLTELIGARLAATGPQARQVLELLALCEPVPLADAQAVTSLDVLADLEEAGLVQVTTDWRRTTVQLAHPLYGEALRADLHVIRRRALLLAQSERHQAHGARRRDDALHIVTWQLAATGTADPRLLKLAAVWARHAHDYKQVISLLKAIPEEHQTAITRLLLGEALLELGESGQAETVLAAAEMTATDERQRLAATLARVMNLFWITGRTAEALAVNDAARTQITSLAGRRKLLTNEAAMRTVSGQPAEGLALLEDLEDDVWQAPNVNVWLRGAMFQAHGLAVRGYTRQAVLLAEHTFIVHQQIAEDPQQARVPHSATQLVPLILSLSEAGRLDEACIVGGTAADTLLTVHAPLARAWVTAYLARAHWQAGRPATARRLFAEVAASARAHTSNKVMPIALSGLAACAAVLGDTTAAQAALAELNHFPSTGLLAGEERLGEAWLHAAHNHLTQARAVLAEAAQAARDTGHITSEALLLTDVARLGGAKDVAGRLAELAQVCDGAFAPARAHLAAALAADDAEELLAASGELQAIGADLPAAEAATAAAAAWRRTGQTRRAAAAANQATACAARCQKARTFLLANAEATATLTDREREIALLATVGTASKDIADAFHLSVRTVNNHLQHVYAKLGVSTRRELASALGQTASPTRTATS